MSKILKWLLIAVIITGIAYLLYYFSNTDAAYKNQSGLNAISSNSPFFFKINDAERLIDLFKEGNPMLDELDHIESFKNVADLILSVDSILHQTTSTNFSTQELDLWLNTELTSKNEYSHAIIAAFPTISKIMNAVELLKTELAKTGEIQEKKYDGKDVFVHIDGKQNNLCFAAYKGVLIISRHTFMLESALCQLDNEQHLNNNPEFSYIAATAGRNALINIYVDHEWFNQLIALHTNKQIKQEILRTKHFGQWTELDLMIKDDELYLNGFTVSSKGLADYINIYANVKAGAHILTEYMPSSINSFISFSASDMKLFFENLNEYRDRSASSSKKKKALAAIQKSTGSKPQDLFSKLIDQNFALVFYGSDKSSLAKNSFFVINSNGANQSKELMHDYLEQYALKNKLDASSGKHEFRIDDATKITCSEFPHPELIHLLFGPYFSSVEANYFTIYENTVIFGNSIASIGAYVKEIFLNNTLEKDADFQSFSSNIASKSNINVYIRPGSSLQIFEQLLDLQLLKAFNEHLNCFDKFKSLSYQLGASKKPEMVSTDIYIKYDPVVTYKPRTSWELGFDTTISMKPQLVRNHKNNQKEIFVQDNANKIYLINHAGRILWEKQLNAAILGQVHQIDYYNNGKLQLLFSTQQKLFVLDRNGNHVERFPVAFNSNATAGVGVADYENNKDYRFFIPCSDKRVYLYGKDGNIVDGWKFKKTESEVTQAIRHIRSKTKDYIVFSDKNRLYILNRKGKERVKADDTFKPSNMNAISFDQDQSRFIVTDEQGTIWFIDTDGKTSSLKIKDFSPNHYFLFEDINADGTNDFVFTDNNQLSVYDQQKTSLCSYTSAESITEAPIYFEFPGNNKKLGLISGNSNTIHLINSDGTLYNGFPLLGNTQFSIGSVKGGNRFNLFVGTSDNFLYNYNVK